MEILEKDGSKFAILNADDTWLKYQKYNKNCLLWMNTLKNYNWGNLFNQVNQKTFEKKVNQKYYPSFEKNNFFNQSGKIKSKYYNINSKQLIFNPDWDEDIILNLFNYFAQTLEWSPPKLPRIIKRIDGMKNKISLDEIEKIGINRFIKKNNVFSYAITSTKTLSYTTFNQMHKTPIL